MSELDQSLNQAIYESFKKDCPSAIERIQTLLNVGQTPKQIEDIVAKKYNPEVARYFYHIAEYLLVNNSLQSGIPKT